MGGNRSRKTDERYCCSRIGRSRKTYYYETLHLNVKKSSRSTGTTLQDRPRTPEGPRHSLTRSPSPKAAAYKSSILVISSDVSSANSFSRARFDRRPPFCRTNPRRLSSVLSCTSTIASMPARNRSKFWTHHV